MSDTFQVISDVHLNFTGGDAVEIQPVDGITGVLGAGDFCDDLSGGKAMAWLADRFAGIPTAVVLGNHDLWDSGNTPGLTYEAIYERTAELGYKLGIHVLQNSSAIIGSTRVLGCSLGTDFKFLPPDMSRKMAMYKSQTGHLPDGDRMFDRTSKDRHNDFTQTHMLDEKSRRVRYSPSRFFAEHNKSVEWLSDQLAIEHADGPTIVLTHMAPTPKMLGGQRFSHDWMYAVGGPDGQTGLEYMMAGDVAPELWVSGHIHTGIDIEIGNTRCLSNPRGYPTRKPGVFENPTWDPELVLEVEKRLTPSLGMGM
jgi:hypothetical protein